MIIFSDPHLGLNRRAHTTKTSRVALADAIHHKALEIASEGKRLGDTVVCAGDLFDTFSNSEEAIINASAVASRCNVILAGNHDSSNRADVRGSLDMIEAMFLGGGDTEIVSNPNFDEPYHITGKFEGMYFAFIPHHPTQELFERALNKLIEEDTTYTLRGVFLHCNYNNDLTKGSDATLNLTEGMAVLLGTVCDYIFIGHEHQPSEKLGGKVVIVGNTHPTSFGDISDKYVWSLNQKTLKKALCWEVDRHFVELDITEGYPPPPAWVTAEFVDIVGSIPATGGADLAQYISDIWHHSSPFMVRNSVSIVSDNHVSGEVVDVADLPARIGKKLKGTNLEETYEYYRGKI